MNRTSVLSGPVVRSVCHDPQPNINPRAFQLPLQQVASQGPVFLRFGNSFFSVDTPRRCSRLIFSAAPQRCKAKRGVPNPSFASTITDRVADPGMELGKHHGGWPPHGLCDKAKTKTKLFV